MIPLAWRDVRHYRRESVGVAVQVGVGIALFVIALSFVAGVSRTADRLVFGTVGSSWLIAPSVSSKALSASAGELSRIAADTGADAVRSRLALPATLSNPDAASGQPASASADVVGADLSTEPILADDFGIPERRIASGSVVLHRQLAAQLGVGAGDPVTIMIGSVTLHDTVSAVVEPETPSFVLESWAILDRSDLAQAVYGDDTRTTQMLVDAPDASRSTISSSAQTLDSDTTVSHYSDTSWSSLLLGSRIWGILLFAVATFAFVVICIGLTSTVYAALLARVRDFAVLATSGARPIWLRRMYLAEVAAQYVVGFVGGAAVASAVIAAVDRIDISSTDDAFVFAVGSTTLSLVPTWWVFLIPFAMGLVLTVGILWLPIRAVCSRPALDLLELA